MEVMRTMCDLRHNKRAFLKALIVHSELERFKTASIITYWSHYTLAFEQAFF
jgi:hypothetical protein